MNNKDIVTKLKVNYVSKKIHYNKDLYCIMTEEMEINLTSANNNQNFSDVTYYCLPPNNKKCRLFVLISFNKEKFYSTLCILSLICNENIETFYLILNFLKNKYNFSPINITIDFSKGE